jgi:hypothetical protein
VTEREALSVVLWLVSGVCDYLNKKSGNAAAFRGAARSAILTFHCLQRLTPRRMIVAPARNFTCHLWREMFRNMMQMPAAALKIAGNGSNQEWQGGARPWRSSRQSVAHCSAPN